MKDNTNLKKQSPRPAEPTAPVIIQPKAEVALPTGEAAEETAQLRLEAFADGYIFKWTGHPTVPGAFVVFNSANEPVATVRDAAIADLMCNAVRMLFDAVAVRQAQAELTDEMKAKNNAAHKAKHSGAVTGDDTQDA